MKKITITETYREHDLDAGPSGDRGTTPETMERKNKLNAQSRNVVVIGEGSISLSQVEAIAMGAARVRISTKSDFVRRMTKSRQTLRDALEIGTPVYGVTTGYGAACGTRIPEKYVEDLGNNLIKYHGCGTGDPLGIEETRAAMACRLICLARGYSGVTIGLLRTMADCLNHGITPVVPSLGSVGASGDLTPMSYIAACLTGERDVMYQGQRIPSQEALSKVGLRPYVFSPKEPLALINGTSVMTGIAVMTLRRSRAILDAALAATALTVHALLGHEGHYHSAIVNAKPHPGQHRAGDILRRLLAPTKKPLESRRVDHLQDPYSIRCAPQILGVLIDALGWIEKWIHAEVNSSNDNPLLDGDRGEVFMGGNFYGGHVAYAMDGLKTALAGVADMLDRQMALLVDPRYNRGLPANLVKVKGEKRAVHHGFKGMQMTASALAAEALKNTMPASSFSRSTESHNQDKVSMGTIAARDAARQCDLVGRIAAVHLMAAVQACELRGGLDRRPGVASVVREIRKVIRDTSADRPMDGDIESLVRAMESVKFF